MKQYLELLRDVYENGVDRENGTDRMDWAFVAWETMSWTRGLFWRQLRVDLSQGFPLLTTKKVYYKAIIHELLWLISGSTNIQYLCKNNIRIWDDWPYASYKKSAEFQWEDISEFAKKISEDDEFALIWWDLGAVYGQQRRKWPTKDWDSVDQLQKAIDRIKVNPYSRRIIVNAWNAEYVDSVIAPPPCHTMYQFSVINGKLSCQLYQRSGDIFLGIPFNIASYALLTHMVAHVCWLQVGDFVHTFWDVHAYNNHYQQIETQLLRQPGKLPTLWLNPDIKNIDDFTYDDIRIDDYEPQAAIRADVIL